ncbi:Ig-like domain-containing protein [Corynebacterium urealyticum]|uniref:Ig-like domain-containing protein n=1 Tax=Corynebacterium urealyticum TaxID=43771 RepID=UPI0011E80C61|nr:Ig-like domain-containing protein [Corynebacterium urealyticum]TYR15093.1 Ig-like domain repeat protein [Corynebacterium urealyticum]TYT20392.1 Ig-like domain repeat protein [Corynebacterium urealyticum]
MMNKNNAGVLVHRTVGTRGARQLMGSASAIALALGLVVATPAQADEVVEQEASASPVTTAVKQVNLECAEDAGRIGGAIGNASQLTLSPDAMDVSYPERVQPGETFTVTVQPGAMTTGRKATARMKYDIALPQGVEISNLRIVDPGTNLNADPAAVVQRVNAAGQPDENGEFARIWDGANSVNNGGNENDNWYTGIFFGGVPRAGLAVDANQQFRLPKIAFDVTAPDTPGAAIRTGLRAAGEGTGPAGKNNKNNVLSLVASQNGAPGTAVAVYCHAGDAARALTNTVIAQATQTELTHTRPEVDLEADAEILPGDEVRFTATVTSAGESLPEVPEGAAAPTVVFYSGDEVIGEAEVDPATGKAVLDHAFAARGEHEVRAEFQEFVAKEFDGTVAAIWEKSESAPVTVTVSAFGFDIDNPEPKKPEEDQDSTGSLGSLTPGAEGSSGELQWWHKLLIVLGSLGVVFGIGAQLVQFLPGLR